MLRVESAFLALTYVYLSLDAGFVQERPGGGGGTRMISAPLARAVPDVEPVSV